MLPRVVLYALQLQPSIHRFNLKPPNIKVRIAPNFSAFERNFNELVAYRPHKYIPVHLFAPRRRYQVIVRGIVALGRPRDEIRELIYRLKASLYAEMLQ